ncbi:hypothetical protein BH24CHL4_BH24CHL4_11350 [soil metagenome]
MPDPLLIANAGELDLVLLPEMANRHGVVTGATGIGKTATIQAMIERFSDIGVPVVVSELKGDVSGLAAPGGGNEKVDERLAELELPPLEPIGFPVVFWDVYGEQGHPVRSTISEIGRAGGDRKGTREAGQGAPQAFNRRQPLQQGSARRAPRRHTSTIGRELGRTIVRGLFGSLKRR